MKTTDAITEECNYLPSEIWSMRPPLLPTPSLNEIVAIVRPNGHLSPTFDIDLLARLIMGNIKSAFVSVHDTTSVNPHTSDIRVMIQVELLCIKEMLIRKNLRYGDSAINPLRVCSSCSNLEQILVRVDDKLSRLARGTGEENEDVYQDLIGYLVLYRVAKRLQKAQQ